MWEPRRLTTLLVLFDMIKEKGVSSSEFCYIFWLPLHWSTCVIRPATHLNLWRRATGLENIEGALLRPDFLKINCIYTETVKLSCVFHYIHTRWVKARSWTYTPWVKLPGSEAVTFYFSILTQLKFILRTVLLALKYFVGYEILSFCDFSRNGFNSYLFYIQITVKTLSIVKGCRTFRKTFQLPSSELLALRRDFFSFYTALALRDMSEVKLWLDEQRNRILTNKERLYG
jgi:hypothetical protein